MAKEWRTLGASICGRTITLVDKLKEAGGYQTDSELIRAGLRALAKEHAIEIKTLSPRTRDGLLSESNAGNVCSTRGESCKELKEEA